MFKRTIIYLMLIVCLVFGFVQCKSSAETTEEPAQEPAAQPQQQQQQQQQQSSQQQRTNNQRDGIYVGVITFGPNAEDITDGTPVLLDREGQGLFRLSNLLDERYQREESGGTALFYAAHMGLANMAKAQEQLPKMDNVIMVTFTDGLDVSSTGLTLTPIRDPGNTDGLQFAGENIKLYENFVKKEIDNRLINTAPISAYIAAVRGDDITNVSAFESALYSLASNGADSRGIPYVLPPAKDISELVIMFEQIANSLSVMDVWTEQTFTMITPQYPKDTRIRMTFGGEANAAQAQSARMYVEGDVTVRDREYYLTNIKYGGGLSSEAGLEIRGVIEGDMVNYQFPMFTGYDMSRNQATMPVNLKQWIMYHGETSWQINSEYVPRPDTVTLGIRKNGLVYIVLDKSSSIIAYDFPRVREAAKLFINLLHYAYYSQY